MLFALKKALLNKTPLSQFSTSQFARVARVQKYAPFFSAKALMPDGSFKQITLDDYKGKSWLLLFTYPLDFTFTCPTEIIAFSDCAQEFEKNGCEVLGCSIDSEFVHLAWTQTPRQQGGLGKINVPLLADVSKKVASDYGVLLDSGIATRACFLIDPKGIVRLVTSQDLSAGRNTEEYLRLLKAYQFADKHGEVCPANWTEGGDTIKPDPKKSKEYFSKQQD